MTRPPFPSVIDSSLMSHFRACPRSAYLESFEHWKHKAKSVHLHAGAAYARGLEVARLAYYQDGLTEPDAIARGLGALMEAYGDFECPPDSAKSLERMCGAFEFYFSHYPMGTDSLQPATLPGGRLGIEFSFAEPIDLEHPETGDPLLYCGRFDMIGEYAGQIFGEDDKTASQLGPSWAKQWDLRCFSPDTELLTAGGWKEISHLQEGEHVMQYQDGRLEFVRASDLHAADYVGSMISMESGRLNQLVTPNHRILLELRRGGKKIIEASELLQQDAKHKIPLSGRYQGEKMPSALQRYIAALQADGTFRRSAGTTKSGQGHREHMPNPAAAFTFTKKRKHERLISILKELDTPYTEGDGSIYVSGFTELQEVACGLLDEHKCFKPETFDLYDEVFLEELEQWDGWNSQYYTTKRVNAEFVQTVAHTNGWRASVQLKINHTQSYVVCLSKQTTCDVGAMAVTEKPYSGKVWCVSVPSSFLLTRRGGVISVSGNSQFTAYTWGARKAGIDMTGFMVRGVSILKTKYDTQQAITYRPQWQLDRWYEQTVKDVQRMIQMWESGAFDFNLDESCNGYGGCQFRKICLAEPHRAINWLETDFERRRWDPVTRVETKLPHGWPEGVEPPAGYTAEELDADNPHNAWMKDVEI